MKMIKHFSHRHPLSPFEVGFDRRRDDLDGGEEEDGDDRTICSGCELELPPGSPGYKCGKAGCEFQLHEACFELPREIRHRSHAGHALGLLFTPHRSFSCAACAGSGTAFVYSCRTCRFGLHVQCSAVPESVESSEDGGGHRHPLRLAFSVPEREKDGGCSCGVCGRGLMEGCWAYMCGECDYGAHVDCLIDDDDDDDDDDDVEEREIIECVEMKEQCSGVVDVSLVVAESQKTIAV